jgi:hypothetical protein
MTCRRLLVLGLPAGLVALAVAAWLLWPRTAITRENAAKIQPGMTLAEVEAFLGGPARDESTGPLTDDDDVDDEPAGFPVVLFAPSCDGEMIAAHDRHFWISDSVVVRVCFNPEGRTL